MFIPESEKDIAKHPFAKASCYQSERRTMSWLSCRDNFFKCGQSGTKGYSDTRCTTVMCFTEPSKVLRVHRLFIGLTCSHPDGFGGCIRKIVQWVAGTGCHCRLATPSVHRCGGTFCSFTRRSSIQSADLLENKKLVKFDAVVNVRKYNIALIVTNIFHRIVLKGHKKLFRKTKLNGDEGE